jgi:hypothetical protein
MVNKVLEEDTATLRIGAVHFLEMPAIAKTSTLFLSKAYSRVRRGKLQLGHISTVLTHKMLSSEEIYILENNGM